MCACDERAGEGCLVCCKIHPKLGYLVKVWWHHCSESNVEANTPVPVVYTPPRDLVAADMARREAELLSRYAARLDTPPLGVVESGQAYNDRLSRATLAREMSVILFRAAELEEKP